MCYRDIHPDVLPCSLEYTCARGFYDRLYHSACWSLESDWSEGCFIFCNSSSDGGTAITQIRYCCSCTCSDVVLCKWSQSWITLLIFYSSKYISGNCWQIHVDFLYPDLLSLIPYVTVSNCVNWSICQLVDWHVNHIEYEPETNSMWCLTLTLTVTRTN